MKNFAFFVSLAVAASAFAGANPFEKRQDPPTPTCVGAVCGLTAPVTLTVPVTFATTTTLLGIGVGISASDVITTTIGGGCCDGATCLEPTVPTTVPVDVALPATITVPVTVPAIPYVTPGTTTTLTLTLPAADFSGGISIPTLAADIGVCTVPL